MACTVDLYNVLTGESTGGGWVYLGYAATTQVPVNSEDPLCHGITDPFDSGDVNNPYGVNPGTDIAMIPNQDPAVTDNPLVVNFDNVEPGFYGFLYIVGDTDGSGLIDGAECGDWTCIEIEVVASPANMGDGALADVCEDSLPLAPFDLEAEVTGFIAGGNWSVSPNDSNIDITDPNAVIVGAGTAPGTYTFTYIINPEDLSSTHDLSACADGDCMGSAEVTLTITDALEAGEGMSIAVCN